MLKQYIAYLKDNPQGYWFKAKLYGWGWVPVNWKGFAVLVLFIVLIIGNFYRLDANSLSESETLINFLPQTTILTAILILICIKKGEHPRWQWGVPKDKK